MVVLVRSEVLCILFAVCGAVLSNVNGAVLTKRHVDVLDSADVTTGTATPGENVLTETHNASEEFPMTSSAVGRVNVSSEMQTQPTGRATGETTNVTVTTSERISKADVTTPLAPALKRTSPDLGGEAFVDKVDVPNTVSESSTSSGDSEHAANPVTSTTTTTRFPHLMSTLTVFSVKFNHGSKTGRKAASKEQVAAIEELLRNVRRDTDDVDAIDKTHSHHDSVIKPVSADASAAAEPAPKTVPASVPGGSSKDEKGSAIQLSPTLIFSSFVCLLVRLVLPN